MNVKSKGFTLHVEIDENPFDPRECDNLGTMLTWHRRYSLGDMNPYKTSQDFWNDKQLHENIFVRQNVYLLDHSGLYLSATPFTAVDPQGWDSGQVGIIYATKTDVQKEFGDLSLETQYKVNEILFNEIEEYNKYLSGTFYQYTIENEEGEYVDSSGEYEGTMEEILINMKEAADKKYSFLFDKMIEQQNKSEMY